MLLSFDMDNGIHSSDSSAKLELLKRSVSGSISAAILLKSLFYIVVWCTFSTCLKLYNTALLGDKFGKFPAPLLMNTFHFVLQTVLSKTSLCFHKGGSDSDRRITWRDYFCRTRSARIVQVFVFYFHDQFTLLKGAGLLTIMIGVSLFNWFK
ncbi:putative sugar phosphate/phosphate translocator [Platanthera guangdongensis]|uniref:Sugar phosphate/phosphate translocator n=1 Tax=Platanthera guangdongensis TaxID=2320717 RepID=A0ABR2M0U7_9ASPA